MLYGENQVPLSWYVPAGVWTKYIADKKFGRSPLMEGPGIMLLTYACGPRPALSW